VSIAIATTIDDQRGPSVVFDGTNYLVTWQKGQGSLPPGIYGVRINSSGVIIDSFLISTNAGIRSQTLARGTENQVLITYSGWAGTVQGRAYNTMRIWGKFYPFVGMEEERSMFKAKRSTPEIFPNPAKSYFTIRLPQSAVGSLLKIFDVSGKLVKVVPTSTIAQEYKEEARISLKGINPGIYFLQFGTEVKKFLVVK
jgi:hypothetical protein